MPGRPELLATTKDFLDYFGLKTLDALPSLAELKDIESLGVQLDFSSGVALPEAAELQELMGSDEDEGVPVAVSGAVGG